MLNKIRRLRAYNAQALRCDEIVLKASSGPFSDAPDLPDPEHTSTSLSSWPLHTPSQPPM